MKVIKGLLFCVVTMHAGDDAFKLIVTLPSFSLYASDHLLDHISVSRFRLINKACAAAIMSQDPNYKMMIDNRKTLLFNKLKEFLDTGEKVLGPDDVAWHSYGSLCSGTIDCWDGGSSSCSPYYFTYTITIINAYLIEEWHDELLQEFAYHPPDAPPLKYPDKWVPCKYGKGVPRYDKNWVQRIKKERFKLKMESYDKKQD